MARRMTKAESKGIGILALIALPVVGIMKIFETVGWVIPAVIFIGAVSIYFWVLHDRKQKRLQYLRDKYKVEEVVQKIFQGHFWQGQTEDQLMDSLGSPVAIDKKLLKTKRREVWKYSHQGANRFGLRITVEDGYVTGWDQKE